MAGLDPRRAKMARHASFNAPPSAAAERRLVNSAPSSPRRDGTRRSDGSVKSFMMERLMSSSHGLAPPPPPPQVCPQSRWTIPKRRQATAPCVDCSLETAPSELASRSRTPIMHWGQIDLQSSPLLTSGSDSLRESSSWNMTHQNVSLPACSSGLHVACSSGLHVACSSGSM